MTLYLGDKQIAGPLKGEINNPYSLLESKYSELEITNTSWLKSQGQWNSKAMYPSVWEKLINMKVDKNFYELSLSARPDNVYVMKPLSSIKEDDTVYNRNGVIIGRITGVGTSSGLDADEVIVYTSEYTTIGKYTNNTTTIQVDVPKSTEPYTDYDFVIDETNETFRLPLKSKTSFVINEDEENDINYRVYNDGYCEQWGIDDTTTKIVTVTLIKRYRDMNYSILHAYHHTNYGSYVNGYNPTSNNTFTINKYDTNEARRTYWKTCGYLAEGEYTTYNLYYYVGDTVQNASLIDVAQVTSALANKVDITSGLIADSRFDGQYVDTYVEVYKNTSAPVSSFEVDVSEYFPDDGYNYMAYLFIYAYKNGAPSVDIGSDIKYPRWVANLNGYARMVCNDILLPIGTGRKINLTIKTASTELQVLMFGYRRIGTNE